MKAHLCRFLASYRDPRVILLAILLLLFSSLPSFADGFTAKQLGDYGNVTVMEVSGNYDARNPDGSTNAFPRQTIAKEFFRLHKDEYDFVVVITNFDFKMPAAEVAGFYVGVKNDIKGIGQEIFNYNDPVYGSPYGSAGRLQGTIDIGNLAGKVSNPLDPGFEDTLRVLAHEMQHRWGSYVHFKDAAGNISSALLGKDGSHWSYLLDSKGSVMYGDQWRDNGDGTFTALTDRKYYSQLDLYLMGMIDKSKVSPMLLIDNPSIDPKKLPEPGTTIRGTARYVTIDDIIAVEGERDPSVKDSQKQFKMAFIYAITPGSFNSADLYGIENIRNGYLPRYSILTDGKGLVQVTSTAKEDVATNPGVLPPSTVPRALPPNIDDAVKWLVNRQQGDGSWTDFSLTTQRDTAETVITLQRFPVAVQSSQAGLAWLGNNPSANTDFLGRRIETTVQAGGNSAALVQELLGRLNSDGGWGTSRSFVSNSTDTALALKALAVAGYSDPQVINQAIIYLKAAQNSDGGWSGEDTASAIQPTAAVIGAFNAYRKSFPLDANLAGAVTFLAAKQNQDGGFGNSPSTIYDSALAVIALQSAGADKTSTGRAVSYILGQQSDSGSWLDSPYQTALAVRAVWQATVDPDLSIKPEDISIIPATITTIPTTAVLSAKVWNLGRSDVTQARVALYDDLVTAENKVAEQFAAFPGQSPVTLTFAIPVTAAKGHFFHVVADPDNQVSESNKNNNSAVKALYPEITYDFQALASDITVSPNPADIGKDVKITVKVTNRGTSDGFNVPVRLFIDQPAAPFDIATLSVDIPAGGSTVKEITWKTALAGAGMPLTVQIDPNNSFAETNKDNNKTSVPVTIIGSTLPNLSVSYKDMTITPTPAREGGNASVSVLVKNDGFSAAENVKVSFYVGVAGKDGVLLVSQVIPAIAVGQVVRAAIDWTAIAVSGGKLITVQVDPDNTIQEISRDDNFTFKDLDILSLPDLAISSSSVAVNPATPKSGDTVTIAVTVQNGGDQDVHNAAVQVKEGGAVIGSTVIPLVSGNSQAFATITYANSGRTGTRQITVTVDPDGLIVERTKDNNSAVKTFGIQDANLWLTEPYFSPNGDSIKDTTDFSFRLAAPAQVSVQIINKKGIAVRTFSGGELDGTAGATVTWDGKNDAGSVVDDGDYQMRVVGTNNANLGILPVFVDTNRSPLTEAIGTEYLLQNNLTCSLPNYSGQWTWLPDESGTLFYVNSDSQTAYPRGIYRMSPSGDDIESVMSFISWSDMDFNYYYNTQYIDISDQLSPDGSKLVMDLYKYDKVNNKTSKSIIVKDINTNRITTLVGDLGNAGCNRVSSFAWSPDSRKVAVEVSMYLEQCANSANDNRSDMLLIDTENLTLTPYKGVWFSLWSPDSQYITYERNGEWINNNPVRAIGVADLKGTTKEFYEPNGVTTHQWLADNKVLIENHSTPSLIISDINRNNISNIEYNELDNKFIISPDRRSIITYNTQGFFSTNPKPILVTQYDLDGKATLLWEMTSIAQPIAYCRHMVDNFYWTSDKNKLNFTEGIDEYANGIYNWSDRCKVYGNRVEVDLTTKSITAIPFPVNITYTMLDHIFADGITALAHGTSAVSSIDRSIKLVDLRDGSSKEIAHEESYDSGYDYTVSPRERYITYRQDGYSGSCTPYWNMWTMSSVYNLTADLRITKYKSVVKLSGIAADKNFAGNKLEYADIKTPDTWNLIMPPSDLPVLNDIFTDWAPPYEGSFYVRLTIWDKAGNSAVSRKRVTWGLSSSITNLYKSLEIFSPNGDGTKDTVELNYQVLEPLHLEFTISDATGNEVRKFTKDYTEPKNDFISWDGRNEAGIVAPDGKYTIKVFDYEFFVTVDNTPPDASLGFSKLLSRGFDLLGYATDNLFKSWEIEYGEGDNPHEWFQLLGFNADSPLDPKDHLIHTFLLYQPENFYEHSFLWLVGKKLRLTAEDQAGNRKTVVTDWIEETFRIVSVNVPSIGEFLQNGVILSQWREYPDHVIDGFETIKIPFKEMHLQYYLKRDCLGGDIQNCVPQEDRWHALGTPITMDTYNPDPGRFSILFKDSELPSDAIFLRAEAIDTLGQEHYTEKYRIGGFFHISEECPGGYDVNTKQLIHVFGLNTLPLNYLRVQIRSDEDNRYALWTDFAVYSKTTGIPFEGFFAEPDLTKNPGFITLGKHYLIRMVGTEEDGDFLTSASVDYPVVCSKIAPIFKYKIVDCNSVSGKARISVDLSKLEMIGPKILSGKGPVTLLSFFIQETENGAYKLLGKFDLAKVDIYSPDNFVDIDTTTMVEGKYKIKVALGFLDANTNREDALEGEGSLIVDRVLPEAKITYPAGSSLVLCPMQTNEPEGPWFAIQPEGTAKDNIGVKEYELFYGEGENPATWLPAETLAREDGGLISKPITGSSALKGTIGKWNITDKRGDQDYVLKLKVTDIAGNVSCTTSAPVSFDKAVDIPVLTLDKALFSPNGDGMLDNVNVSYEIDKYAQVDVKVFKVIEKPDAPPVLDATPVRTIISGQSHISGTEHTAWDGKDDTSSNLPDGRYGIAVFATDGCGNSNRKWLPVEVDNTPPTVAIAFPRPIDPLPPGVMIEIKGTATEQHFKSYLLEAGEGDAPTTWKTVITSDKPVSNAVIFPWNTFGLKDHWTLRLTAEDTVANKKSVTSTIDLGVRKELVKGLDATPRLFSPNNDQKLDTTAITFEVTDACDVKVDLLDYNGQIVKSFTTATGAAGKGTFVWDGKSNAGSTVPDGTYTVSLVASLTANPLVTQTETLSLIVDTTPPAMTFADPADNACLNSTELYIIGTINDPTWAAITLPLPDPPVRPHSIPETRTGPATPLAASPTLPRTHIP